MKSSTIILICGVTYAILTLIAILIGAFSVSLVPTTARKKLNFSNTFKKLFQFFNTLLLIFLIIITYSWLNEFLNYISPEDDNIKITIIIMFFVTIIILILIIIFVLANVFLLLSPKTRQSIKRFVVKYMSKTFPKISKFMLVHRKFVTRICDANKEFWEDLKSN